MNQRIKILKPHKVLFMGTPGFSVPILKALHVSDKFDVALVVSQPDRPRGRKLKLTPSPVKAAAQDLQLEVISPEKVSADVIKDYHKDQCFDFALVVAYGQILRQDLLDLLPGKFINIHASLLPKWRGAAPIQRSIMEGDESTGVAFQVMEKTLDTGPLIYSEEIKIEPNENSIELADRLSTLSAACLESALVPFLQGEVEPRIQSHNEATYANKISKEESFIDWNCSAQEINNRIRGLQWGPGAVSLFRGKRLKIIATEVVEDVSIRCGQVFALEKDRIVVGTGLGGLALLQVQPAGKAPMGATDFINGYGLNVGDSFEAPPD